MKQKEKEENQNKCNFDSKRFSLKFIQQINKIIGLLVKSHSTVNLLLALFLASQK